MQQAACGSSQCHISPIETDSAMTSKTNKFHIAGGMSHQARHLKCLIRVILRKKKRMKERDEMNKKIEEVRRNEANFRLSKRKSM